MNLIGREVFREIISLRSIMGTTCLILEKAGLLYIRQGCQTIRFQRDQKPIENSE